MKTQDYVESRIRAGVPETVTTDPMQRLGIDTRMNCEGMIEGGLNLADKDRPIRIDLAALIGGCVTVYGQTEPARSRYNVQVSLTEKHGLPQ